MDSTKTLMLAAGALVSFATAANAADTISADEARAIVAEMLADADSRSSLMQGGHSNSEMKIGGYTQIRYHLNFLDDDGSAEDFENGFSIPRTDIALSGTVHDTIKYKVGGRFDGDDSDGNGDFELRDAYVRWEWDNGWGLQFGQYKLPVWREDFISSSRQLAVERSIVDDVFSASRAQAIHIDYKNDNFRWWLAFSDGFKSDSSRWFGDNKTGAFGGGEADYAFTSRVDIKFAGDWKQFREFTSAPGSDNASLLGLAIHWEGGEQDNADGGENYDGLAWVVDFMYKGDGWNLFAGYVGAWQEVGDGDNNDRTDHGFVVQGGFYLPDTNWELFARYDVVIPDDESAADDSFNTLTFGTNHYLHGHAAKFTFDVVWYFDATTDTDVIGGVDNNPSTALLTSSEDDQVALRGQFQLRF